MRKCGKWLAGSVLLCASACLWASDTPSATYTALTDMQLQHAQTDLNRIRGLVDSGALPRTRLEQAEIALADAQDESILVHTLYTEQRLQDMTSEQAKNMIDAAQRRVERQEKLVTDRRELLQIGIMARSEFAVFDDELTARKQTLQLAQNRVKLLDDLKQMAAVEQQLERAVASGSPKNVMVRFEGNGLFTLNDLPTISAQFEKHFHHALPVSALGQTLVHQSMGLDHRNRVDVALNPDQAEGIWLRQLLEHLHVPYLAFRTAMVGAATAPHIHIGLGSTRLKLAQR